MRRVAVDVGGTFTDAVAYDERTGAITLGKSLTRDDIVVGIEDAMGRLAVDPGDVGELVHGSTLAINAILERRGARTALLTTRGFRDIYEIGRINRPDSFNLSFRKHRPLIPRDLIFETSERMRADGTEERPLDEHEVRRIGEALGRLGVEAVAIVFLHSYRWPAHEQRAAALIRDVAPSVYVVASHQLSREYREFERTSTTAASAYVGPLINTYLGNLDTRLRRRGLAGDILLMRSSGGMQDIASTRTQCLQMLESGPAGGVVGAASVGDELGISDLIAFDVGGTTAKACVLRHGQPSLSSDYFIGGYSEGLAIRIPILDIVEVGTGGGSVAWIDEGGSLHVGPRSAGAKPGPAAYGRGGVEATVTDASIFLGEIGTDSVPGAELTLNRDAAERAIRTRVAEPLGLDPTRAAVGVLEIATASMANSVRAVTVERGLDPRDFTLVAYGGGGPLRAVGVARALDIPKVVIPRAPATFAALGMLLADRRHDYVQTIFASLGAASMAELEAAYRELEDEARRELGAAAEGSLRFDRAADIRYVGQEHSVVVRLPDGPLREDAHKAIKAAFDAAHLERFSHHAPEQPAQLVSIRLAASLPRAKPRFPEVAAGGELPDDTAIAGTREVTFDASQGPVICRRYRRDDLRAANVVWGPALIEEAATVTVVPMGVRATVESHGHLILELLSLDRSPS